MILETSSLYTILILEATTRKAGREMKDKVIGALLSSRFRVKSYSNEERRK